MAFRLLFVLAATLAACGGSPGDGGDSVDARRSIDAAPLPGDTCGNAERIELPEGLGTWTVSALTEPFRNDYDSGCTSAGPDRVYVVSVAAGHRLIVRMESTSGGYALISPLLGASACELYPVRCSRDVVVESDAVFEGPGMRLMYRNLGTTAVDIYLIVEIVAPDDSQGSFDLEVEVDAIPPRPPGDTCELAETLTLVDGMATVLGTFSIDSGYRNDWGSYAPPCLNWSNGGPEQAYEITVDPGQRLEGKLTRTVGGSIYLLGGPAATCDAVCFGSARPLGPNEPGLVNYDNTTNDPVDIFAVVESRSEFIEQEDFRVDFRSYATPRGETCAQAETIDLSSGTATVNGTMVDYLDDLAPTCAAFPVTGADRFYRLSIPAHHTLTVTATPSVYYNTGLYLIAAPATNCTDSATCLAADNTHGDGMADTVTYTNNANAALDVILGVDGSWDQVEGTYALAITVAP